MKSSPHVPAVRSPFRLSLRIRHPSIDPSELSREFALEPLYSFRAGDARTAVGLSGGSTRHAGSYWLADLESAMPASLLSPPGAGGALEAQWPPALHAARQRAEQLLRRNVGMALAAVSLRLLQPRASLLKRISAEDGEVTLLAEISRAVAESFTIAPQVMRPLAEWGVTVSFEFSDG